MKYKLNKYDLISCYTYQRLDNSQRFLKHPTSTRSFCHWYPNQISSQKQLKMFFLMNNRFYILY